MFIGGSTCTLTSVSGTSDQMKNLTYEELSISLDVKFIEPQGSFTTPAFNMSAPVFSPDPIKTFWRVA